MHKCTSIVFFKIKSPLIHHHHCCVAKHQTEIQQPSWLLQCWSWCPRCFSSLANSDSDSDTASKGYGEIVCQVSESFVVWHCEWRQQLKERGSVCITEVNQTNKKIIHCSFTQHKPISKSYPLPLTLSSNPLFSCLWDDIQKNKTKDISSFVSVASSERNTPVCFK